ncbi:hypothetical protein, partial [Silicimonas algicola]|uniref:hypothetical protein n=1 Tax=Silicimonas algicola TaxID=1826607 RepID=UPI001B86A509
LRFLAPQDHTPLRHRRPIRPKQPLRLVFVDVHLGGLLCIRVARCLGMECVKKGMKIGESNAIIRDFPRIVITQKLV